MADQVADTKNVRRFDRIALGTIARSDDGSITSEAIITRAGVFSYRLADGSTQKEFRSPEEVFSADSMASAKMLPITNGHPAAVFIDPSTAQKYSVGFTGEAVTRQDNNLAVPVKINTDEGIKAVNAGRRQFSCGYAATTTRQDGVWEGESFSHVQTNIRYNHLALVDVGRAGPAASLRRDTADASVVIDEETLKGTDTMADKIELGNGISYDAAPEVIVAFEEMKKELEALKAELAGETEKVADVTAEKDTLQGKSDGMQAKIDATDKVFADAVQAGIVARLAILDDAKKFITGDDAKKLDAMGNDDIRKAVIAAARPQLKLDDKNADYLDGVYASVVSEGAPSKQDKNGADIVGDNSGRSDKADPEQARLDSMKRMADASRAPIGEAK